MFDLIVMLSRYLFTFYIIFFLWNGLVYVVDEQGGSIGDPDISVSIQRIIIIFMHITAFLILSYDGGFTFNIKTITFGAAGLIFLIVSLNLSNIFYKKGCPLIWNGMFFLLDIGIIMLQRLNPELAQKQLLWMCIGISVMLLIPIILSIVPRFEKFEYLYIILSIILMVSPLILGKELYGSKNWINIGPIGFQPSEIVKFLYIFYVSSVFRKKVDLKQLIITAVLSASIVMLLVLQRDLGGALIFFITYMILIYVATSNEFIFLGGMAAVSFGSILAYNLFSHVRVRVMAWLNPWADIDGGGYQIVQSLFAIGTWGFFGSGLTKGIPKSVPVVERDFIFAAVCEEFGSIFGICVVCIFIMIFLRGIITAIYCQRRYYSLLAAGIMSMFALQTFLILGGVIKIIPLTGVTLPFISYGGSSIMVSIMMIGLVQWINAFQEKRNRNGGDYY